MAAVDERERESPARSILGAVLHPVSHARFINGRVNRTHAAQFCARSGNEVNDDLVYFLLWTRIILSAAQKLFSSLKTRARREVSANLTFVALSSQNLVQ